MIMFLGSKLTKWQFVCFVFLLFAVGIIIFSKTAFAETRENVTDLTIDQNILAVDGENGLLYTIDRSKNLAVVDLQNQKIDKMNLAPHGFIQQIITDLSQRFLFIAESMADGRGNFYILDKQSIKENRFLRGWLASVGRGRIISSFNSKTNKLYLTSSIDNKVLVFNISTDVNGTVGSGGQVSVLKTSAEILISVGPGDMVIDEELNKIYVLSENAPGFLDIIDGSDDKIIKTLPLEGRPQSISIDQKRGRIFVASRIVDKLFVLDANKDEFVAEMAIPAGLESLFFDKTKETLYLLSDTEGLLILGSDLKPKNINLGEFASFGSSPLYVYSGSSLGRLYVLNAFSGSLFVINDGSGEIINKIKIDGFPLRIAGWPEGKRVFILRKGFPRLLVIDETTLLPESFLERERGGDIFFSSPQFIRYNSFRDLIYVTNLGNGSVTVIDGKTKMPIKVISVGAGPVGINFNYRTGKIYTSNREGNSVTIINGDTYETKTLSVGVGPNAIAINDETNKIYISQSGEKSVVVIDGNEDKILKVIPVGLAPQNIQSDSVRNRIYVANLGEDTLSVIDGEKDEVVNKMQVAREPMRIQLINEKIFVTTEGDNSLFVIDKNTEKILKKIELKAMPNHIIWDESQNEVLIIHKHIPLVTTINPQSYEILAEKEFPFFSAMDFFYNKFSIDWERKLIYFTQGSGNSIHVVAMDGNLSDGSFRLAAIIQSDGEIIWRPGFESLSPKGTVGPVIKWFEKNKLYFIVIGIIIGVAVLIFHFLKKSASFKSESEVK